MGITRRQGLLGALSFATPAVLPVMANARQNGTTLRHITGNTVNTLDPTMLGATHESFGVSMNVYDRLVTFGRKQSGSIWTFDPDVITGELAERYEISDDGCTITLHLRPDATWHDGTPVTADDVKWSLDRGVSARSLTAPQFSSGSLTSTEQFRVAGARTIEILLPRPDRLALANLAMPYAIMINSRLARRHATPDDPWAQQWMQQNTAAGGAYRVERFTPGVNIILTRNDAWGARSSGTSPFFERVISQTVPEATTRASLIERGDADIVIDLEAYDVIAMTARRRVRINSVFQSNCFTHLAFDTQSPPFDNVKVRRAVASALPYQDMFTASLFGRGHPLFDADWREVPPDISFPQALPLATDLKLARRLLAEAGFPDGFATTFSYATSQATTAEPMAALIQEALKRIGIQVDIRKLPDAEFNTLEAEKRLPFYTDTAAGWIQRTYYFFYLYFTRNQRWNFSSWRSPEMVELTGTARFETDRARYEDACRKMIALLADQVPLIMLWQPNMDAVTSPDIDGFTYQFHRQIDFRNLRRV
ncbi:ABC transporter substrate-binding protein [Gluconacetobacter azotocaptans]|uniref:ABC transporter substrate-binding protein n=1 Tax=Gluconacetobacter azotocaptans TaxID=142834 RepID=UPI00195EDFB4|nr:ABC transporter substrate-binding protein [Gluconacetobacter azotocaptans]MBM9402781.1 ABC transporter substrate-binding protein [Gluconacetobacter azotocaptans]